MRRVRRQWGRPVLFFAAACVVACGSEGSPDRGPDGGANIAEATPTCSPDEACLPLCLCQLGSDAACKAACETFASGAPDGGALASEAPDGGALAFEERVIELTNDARRRGGCWDGECFGPAAPLAESPLLHAAARAYATDLASSGYLSHTGRDGRTPVDRVRDAGLPTTGIAENLSRGQPSPDAVVGVWLTSRDHCANVLWASARYIGVGYAQAIDEYTDYWVEEIAE